MIIWLLRRFRYVRDLESRLSHLSVPTGSAWSAGSAMYVQDQIKRCLAESLPLSIYADVGPLMQDDTLEIGTFRVRMAVGNKI